MSLSEVAAAAPDFKTRRLGMIMEPEKDNPMEVEGVLNPAAARGRDGQLYLFPRLVSKGNYSRIGIARVLFGDNGDPIGVERLGIALEPTADYELRADGGGCEDPRITFLEPLDQYVMTYTAFSKDGPRIALAISEDLFSWRRLGLASFTPYRGIAFEGVTNKDASIFPIPIPDPKGRPSVAMIHRPLFPGTRAEEIARKPPCRAVDLHRESIWISYSRMDDQSHHEASWRFSEHHRLASPVEQWEHAKIGGGAPPVMTRHGWLLIYHGVHKIEEPGEDLRKLCYSAGLMVLSASNPQFIVYRGKGPLLAPGTPDERRGVVSNVVFPTAIDRRDDLGEPHRLDIYYGMADYRIGAASITIPEKLDLRSVADPPEQSESGLYSNTTPKPSVVAGENGRPKSAS